MVCFLCPIVCISDCTLCLHSCAVSHHISHRISALFFTLCSNYHSLGCGSASGNEYCDVNTEPGNHGCIPSSAYSADYYNDAFSAEVGDWNGKYGLIEVNINDTVCL